MRTSRAVAVSALLAVAAVNLLAACTPEDDNDTFSTPTPVEPTPTPAGVHCQIVWASQGTNPSEVDVFVIDAAQSAWIAGVNTFGSFTGFYQPALDLTGFSVPMSLDEDGAIALSTNNSFTVGLNINGTADGSPLTLASLTTADLLVIGTDGLPTSDSAGIADAFDFTGEWSSSDPDSPAVEVGTGAADLLLGSGTNFTAVTIGDFGTYAICYEAASFQSHTVAGLKRWHR